MSVTERKKKKPPTFHYLPKSRARRLKKSWVEDHKIRSKWKVQKRREGLTNQTSEPVEETNHDHDHHETTSDSQPDISPQCADESPVPTTSHDKQSLRDLRKIAYTSKPRRTQSSGHSHPKRVSGWPYNERDGKATVRHGKGQPNMKLHMNVLLEKIKRGFP